MNELSQRARDLIETVGNHDGPGPSDRDRVRRTLLTALAGAGTTAAGSAGAAASASAQAGAALGSGALAAGAGKVSVTVALWLVGGGVAGFAIATPIAMYAASPLSITAPAAPTTATGAQPLAPRAIAATEPAPPSPAAELVMPLEVNAVPTPRERTGLDTAPEPAKAATPSVSAEVDLLKNAQRALSAGNAATALALLDRHGRDFPGGAMVVERMAAQVFALCELGRVEEARRVAGAFLKAAPNSPLVPRVTASCAK